MVIANNSNKYQVHNVTKEKLNHNKKAKASFDFSGVESADFKSVMKNQFSNQKLPVIGAVAIPQLDINLPIFKGVDNISLLYGAGTMKPNQVMGKGNYTLAGHNMTGFSSDLSILFTPLMKATKGMTIYTTDKENIYQYRIDEIKTVTPNHIEVLDDTPNKNEITLVTCAEAEAVHRTVIHGTLSAVTPYTKATSEMSAAFSRKYNQAKNF